ncbi:MAG: fructosamine kinase family protein [Mogibacterium sp.]|nr:fructosamine kinase family protein [Mogibacterium sp.]
MNRLDEVIKREFGAGISVLRRTPVSGGDINRAYALDLSGGNKVFMKANSRSNIGFFKAEAEGLAALKQTGTVRIPEVIDAGEDGSSSFLLLEFIESGTRTKGSSEELGTGLAAMHMAAAEAYARGGKFGFSHDNYIGAGEQINSPRDTWTEFFIECRLLPQFERAAEYFDRGERKKIDSFLSRADNYLAEPDHPSLLHGDLWSGNYMIDRDGHPWLIDPAVYVGHAEADLAMTELFGGFDRTFYEAYRSTAGIDPGYKDRKDLYNLYHMLNHLNLFGGGYLYSVRSIINRYI